LPQSHCFMLAGVLRGRQRLIGVPDSSSSSCLSSVSRSSDSVTLTHVDRHTESVWETPSLPRLGTLEPHRREGRAENLSKAAFVNHPSRLLWSHPPALPLHLLRPVIELAIDGEQRHFDAAEGFPIVWQLFAVMVATD
jgi:hypothetical protein